MNSNREVYFIGLLSNVDSSILSLRLKHNFKVEGVDEEVGMKLLSNLEGMREFPPFHQLNLQFMNRIAFNLQCLNSEEKKFYILSTSFSVNLGSDPQSFGDEFRQINDFNERFVYGYLSPTLRLLRLFQEGDIRMPLTYYYFLENGHPKRIMYRFSTRHVSDERFKLNKSELSRLNTFITQTTLPFTKSYLQLALENFELSYAVQYLDLAFLSSMISLETLLILGHTELSHRISRNVAVLLSKTQEDGKRVFSEMRSLYTKRSNIVHAGKRNVVSKDDLMKLRNFVRESIKKVHSMAFNKKKLSEVLNSHGFGSLNDEFLART